MQESFDWPKVSVIVPVLNGERFLARCLDCLLQQRYPAAQLEIIFVDNDSTDQSAGIIQSYGVKCIRVTRKGPGAARNEGLKIASGEIIVFIDVDCLAAQDLILHHVLAHKHFKVNEPRIKMIGGAVLGYNQNIWSVCDDFCSWFAIHPSLPPGLIPFHPTANLSIRKELIDAGFNFDETLISGEDFDLCIRVTRAGYGIYFEPTALVYHINRVTFSGFLQHAKDWTLSEYEMRQKGTVISVKLNVMQWILVYVAVFGGKVLEVLYHSFRVKRFQVILFLPLIMANKFYHCFLLLMIELKFNKNRTRTKGVFFNYCRQRFQNVGNFIKHKEYNSQTRS